MPVWENVDLVANEETDYGVSADDSALFLEALAGRLGVDTNYIMPAYEDAWYYLWKERRLPANVDPLESHLEDELVRARLARVFEQRLGKVVGHVLPIKRERAISGAAWASGTWFLTPARLYLVPGDSPIGSRLPVDSFSGVTASEYPRYYEPDPLAERGPLPARQERDRQSFLRAGIPEDYRKFLGQGAISPDFVPQNRPDPAREGRTVSGQTPQRGEVCAMDRPDRDGC